MATEWAGGNTLAFSEVEKYQSKILESRFPGVPNLGDVTKLCRRCYDCEPIESEYYEDGILRCPRCSTEYETIDFGDCECIGTDQFIDEIGVPDVIAGGVPCQPASLVGKRNGTSDPRWLWPDTIRIIRELRPRFAILENPRAILTLEGGQAFRGILSAFAQSGYDVQWDVVSASALGAGHRRDRLWLLASDSHCAGLERLTRNGEDCGQAHSHRHPAPQNLSQRAITSEKWYHQSGLLPVVNGIPGGLVRKQLTAVGNSLVPQVALVWMRAIAAHYSANR